MFVDECVYLASGCFALFQHTIFYDRTMKIQRPPPLLLPPVAPSSAPLPSERSAAAAHPATGAWPASPPGSSSPLVTPWHRSQETNFFSMEGPGQRLGERLAGTLTRRRRPTSPDPPWPEPDPPWPASRTWVGMRARVGLTGAGERGMSVGEREERRGERCAVASESREEGASPRVRCFQLESGVSPTLKGTVKNRVPPALKTHGCALAFLFI